MNPLLPFYLGICLIVVGGWVGATAKLHLKPEHRASAFSIRGGLQDLVSSERYTATGRRWRIAGYSMALAGLILVFYGYPLLSLLF